MVVFKVPFLQATIYTTVTSYGNDVSAWIDSIYYFHRHRLNSLIVGVDVKWCPHGRYGTRGRNPIATLQLCIGCRCLIFKLLHCDYIPEKLNQFLRDNQFLFVGMWIIGSAQRLHNDYQLLFGRNVHDLRKIAALIRKRPEMRNFRLRHLVEVVKGLHIDVPPISVRLSNWGTPILSREQIECAAVDAFLTFTVCWELERHH